MPENPLRVAVDATPLLGARSGVGNVVAALLDGLAARPDVAVTAFPLSIRGRGELRSLLPDGVRAVTPPLPARALRWMWERSAHPRVDLAIGRHDVVHGANFVVPPTRAARVVTVHDLTTLRYPELCHPDTLVYPALVKRAADEGAYVHTVSHAVRDEVIAELHIDPAQVVAVPNGVDATTGDPATGRLLAGVSDYVLAVGTVEPRKDLPTLVAAVDRLAGDADDLVVVHVGGNGWGMAGFHDALEAMAHRDRFRRLGRVDARALTDLYAGARVLAFPSVYEGFGLPVLEAMAASVPVVTTDVPAIREVAGDAAALCAVGDVDGLAAALQVAWTDEAWRATAVARGHERCRAHRWDVTVDAMVDLYRDAAAGSDGGRRRT